jgi:GAF domain-containing protein/HAMP domain-containing protein
MMESEQQSFGSMSGFLDWLRLGFQIDAPVGLKFVLLGLVGLIFIILAVYFARNLYKFSLRAQLVLMFIFVSSLSIGAATLFSVLYLRRTVTYEKNLQLYQAAVRTSDNIDGFITSSLQAISAESQLPEIIDFLSLSPDKQQADPDRDIATNILYLLAQKDPKNIASYALFTLNGIDIIDTNRLEIGVDKSQSDYILNVRKRDDPYASKVEVSQNFSDPIINFCAPVKKGTGDSLGILCVRYFTSKINQIIDGSQGLAGAGSHAFLIDENHKRLPGVAASDLLTNLPGLEQAIEQSDIHPIFTAATPASSQTDARNASLEQGAIVSLDTQPWKIIYVVDRATFLAPIEAQTRVTILLALGIAAIAALVGMGMAQILTVPISQLTQVARQISAGDLSAQAPSKAPNELGMLAMALNTMTLQLRAMFEKLEERVSERTRELTRRANQLQASAEVGSAIVAIRSLDELLPKVSQLISQSFGFYHAGIFLIDPTGEYAVLRAANSEGGMRMLARNHQLRVNEEGIVGYVTGKKEPRIAMDVGQDAVYFNNPDLPETRSEMALPLVVGDLVLGALDVQSTEPDAFTQEDIATLQLLAAQVAVAIDNARLFSENQAVLEAIRRAYGEVSREAWSRLLHTQPEFGAIANKYDILYTPSEGWSTGMIQVARGGNTAYTNNGTVAIPIKDRDHILGVLRLRKPDTEVWSHEELALAETLAQQLYLALENARLFQETQRRAVREQLTSEITAKMRTSNDPQVILQTAVQELSQALNLQRHQETPPPESKPARSPSNNEGSASQD